jgi:hypothetical protein
MNDSSGPRLGPVMSRPGAVVLLAASRRRAVRVPGAGQSGSSWYEPSSLDRQPRLLHDPVADPEQPVGEPAVLGALVGRGGRAARRAGAAVAAVVQPQLARNAAVGEPVPPLGERLRLDVPVVEPVDDEHAGPHALDAAQVVARRPERAPVAGDAVLLLHRLLAHVRALGDYARGDEVGQRVGVLAEVAAVPDALPLRLRRDDEPVGR